jgi:hypothetical protein
VVVARFFIGCFIKKSVYCVMKFWHGFYIAIIGIITTLFLLCRFTGCISGPTSSAPCDTTAIINNLTAEQLQGIIEIPADTITFTETDTFIRYVPVAVADTSELDSLRAYAEDQQRYFAGLMAMLNDSLLVNAGRLEDVNQALRELKATIREYGVSDVVEDSLFTLSYVIRAWGPISAFEYDMQLAPSVINAPVPQNFTRRNSLFVGAGLQGNTDGIRDLYSIGYRRRWLWAKYSYLPRRDQLTTAHQIEGGVSIQFGKK